MDSRHGPAIGGAGGALTTSPGDADRSRPVAFLTSLSLQLDELVLESEGLRHSLRSISHDSPQVDRLSADLLICEAKKLTIEGALRL